MDQSLKDELTPLLRGVTKEKIIAQLEKEWARSREALKKHFPGDEKAQMCQLVHVLQLHFVRPFEDAVMKDMLERSVRSGDRLFLRGLFSSMLDSFIDSHTPEQVFQLHMKAVLAVYDEAGGGSNEASSSSNVIDFLSRVTGRYT